MLSKTGRSFMIQKLFGSALVCAALLQGCSLRLNDPVEKPVMNVSLGGGCLSESGAVLGRFAKGSATESELDGFWSCAEKALITFNAHTEGDKEDSYKAADLGKFFSKYFLKGKEISPVLLNEAMALKQSFFGGRDDRLTRQELKSLLRLMKVGRRVSQRLRPHMPVRHDSFIERKYTKEQFETAITDFQESMAELGDALKDTQTSYSLDHFGTLFAELGKFLYAEGDPDAQWVNTVQTWSHALRPAKAIFISQPKDEIQASDWATIYRMGPKYYALYLRARFYSHGQHNYAYGPGLLRLESLFDDSISLISQVLEQRPGKEIRSEEIDELLNALEATNLLPVTAATARAGVKLTFGKLFRNQDTGDAYTIRLENLAQLSRNFHFATEGLRALEQIYRTRFGEAEFETQGLVTQDFVDADLNRLLQNTLLQDNTSRAAIASLAKSAGEISTVFPARRQHIYVPNGRTKPKLSIQHMAKIHLLRSVNRLLIDAYAGPKADGLSEKQLNALLKDMFPLFQDAKLSLIDAETVESFPTRIFEASLFLPSSDGDKGLTMNEAIEFEALLMSTVTHANTVWDNVTKGCYKYNQQIEIRSRDKKNEARTKRDVTYVKQDCFRQNWIKLGTGIWGSIPGLADYFSRLTPPNKTAFFNRLDKFLRKDRLARERPGIKDFTISDTRAFILMPYYVELLFARFDSNRDGLLENAEAERAYPVVQPFLSLKAAEKGKTDPKDHHALFMYLLANRTLPSSSDWGSAIGYIWRRYVAGDEAFKVDRGQVVEIFEKLLSSD